MAYALEPQELQLLKDIRYAMLTTQESDGDFHDRPVYTHGVDDDGKIWFFTHATGRKVREMGRDPRVGVSYEDHGSETYVTLAGTAEVVKDQAKIDELWVDGLKAWFSEGKDDPSISLVKVHPHQGEYWDKPGGKLNTLFQMAEGAVIGEPDQSQINQTLGEKPVG